MQNNKEQTIVVSQAEIEKLQDDIHKVKDEAKRKQLQQKLDDLITQSEFAFSINKPSNNYDNTN